jgi:hypothetical protein
MSLKERADLVERQCAAAALDSFTKTEANLKTTYHGTITYQVEAFSACVFEIVKHVSRHWEEVASRKDIRQLDVDWETYLQADRIGRITLGTARHGPDERLIGYLMMMQRPDLNSKGTIAAESAVYYVEPRPMRGLIQRNLIRFMRDHLLAKGITYQRFRCKLSHSNDSILRNVGFEPDEMLYILKG